VHSSHPRTAVLLQLSCDIVSRAAHVSTLLRQYTEWSGIQRMLRQQAPTCAKAAGRECSHGC
jgi:hypothetical protein